MQQKVLWVLNRAFNENNNLERSEVINKRAAGIIWKCKNLLYLEIIIVEIKKYNKMRDHCHYTESMEVLQIACLI